LGGIADLRARTITQATRYLSALLEAALVDGLIVTNPAHRARRPRVEREPVTPFTDGEIAALRDAVPEWFTVALTLGSAPGSARQRRPGSRSTASTSYAAS